MSNFLFFNVNIFAICHIFMLQLRKQKRRRKRSVEFFTYMRRIDFDPSVGEHLPVRLRMLVVCQQEKGVQKGK